MGVDNFFVVGGGGLVLPHPICDHSYLLLDRRWCYNKLNNEVARSFLQK